MAISELLRKGIEIWVGTYVKKVTDIGDTDIVQVASTAIDEVTYDVTTHTLGVTFKESRATYSYFGVPESVYESLIFAGSVGQEFNFEVKGSYFYVRQ